MSRRLQLWVGPWTYAPPDDPQGVLEFLSCLEFRERMAKLTGLWVCIGCARYLECAPTVASSIRLRNTFYGGSYGDAERFYEEGGACLVLPHDHRFCVCSYCRQAVVRTCDYCRTAGIKSAFIYVTWPGEDGMEREYLVCPSCLHHYDPEEFRRYVKLRHDLPSAQRAWKELADRLSKVPVGSHA